AIASRVEKLVEDGLGPSDARTLAALRVQMMLAWKRGDRAAVDALRARVVAQPARRRPIAGSARITGRVVDDQGRPIAGAEVAAGVVIIGDDRALDMTAGGESH